MPDPAQILDSVETVGYAFPAPSEERVTRLINRLQDRAAYMPNGYTVRQTANWRAWLAEIMLIASRAIAEIEELEG